MKKKGLGRGLAALIEDTRPVEDAQGAKAAARSPETVIPLDLIRPNPDQPRKRFDSVELEELAESIRANGVIQPLILRRDPHDAARYEIVAGERRWRAAQIAGLHDAPAVIREFSDLEVLQVALIENIQRADLNPIEEAISFSQLVDRFDYSQGELAKSLGKSRSYLVNSLRLLTLPESVQMVLREGGLTAGHGRALLQAPDPAALARRVVAGGLSVRETEALARKAAAGLDAQAGRRARPEKDPDTRALEEDLTASLGLKVHVAHRRAGGGGEVRVRYRTLDELDGLCQLLGSR